MHSCFISIVLFCSSMAVAMPTFIDVPKTNDHSNPRWGTYLKDILNHTAPGDGGSYEDPVTWGHEFCHGIHAWIRNDLAK